MKRLEGNSIALEARSRWAWIVALVLTSLVTLAGFVVAVQQFVVKYAIIFLVFEKGKGSGITASGMRKDRCETLLRFGKWPDDWKYESE